VNVVNLGFQKGSKSPMGSLQVERGGCTSQVELMNNLPRLQTKASRREDVVISVAGGSCDEDSQAAAAVAANAEEPEEEEPLTPLGRMFLEPELELFGLCTIGFQNLVDLAQLKLTLRNTLLQNKYFSSIVVLGCLFLLLLLLSSFM